ncbi:MAG: DUF5522 domain-containing protein [Candidatus Nanopelagicales bacterium]|nr:DUF5522 domain-containing protein [Candidatus Nanopelagicales bacterium]
MPAASRPLTQPHADRLPADHPDYDQIILRHAAAMERGDAGYPDPATGLFVLTAAAHATRGTCCTNGCRHCPYV